MSTNRTYRNHLLLIGCVVCTAIACEARPGEPTTHPTDSPPRVIEPDANGKVMKTDAEWKKILTEDQFYILRRAGTERPYQNKYHDNHAAGTYLCAGCGNKLFASETKFESGTGWPSFYQPLHDKAVIIHKDPDGMREEVLCARCGGHLGHVFDDGPKPTGNRFCMNSGAMSFVKSEK